jgi:protein O-GlcNAc transferase
VKEAELIESATTYLRNGEIDRAAEIYREHLQRVPTSAAVLYHYGRLVQGEGQHEMAVEIFRRAVSFAPNQSEYHGGLGESLVELGNYGEAEVVIARAIQLRSRPEYHNCLGLLRMRQERIPEAILSFRHALKQNPTRADTLYNLGICYHASGETEVALGNLDRSARSNFKPAVMAIAQILRSVKRSSEALSYLIQTVAAIPPDPELYCALGDSYQDMGNFEDAATAYRKAIDCQSNMAGTWYKLGCAECNLRQYVPAVASFREALQLHPNWLEAEHNLGRALYELGQADEAMSHFRKCIDNGLGLSRAMAALIAPGVPSEDNDTILALRQNWAKCDLPEVRLAEASRPHRENFVRPIRLGYVSSFFHRENWMKPVWGLINQHDRSAFQINLFSSAPASAINTGYRPYPNDTFHDIRKLSNEDLYDLIRKLEIDILVDLNSYSDLSRLPLFALKPAPALVAWFNLYATSGMTCFDYLVGDNEVIPAKEEGYYTERILKVPGSYLPFRVDYPVPDVVDPPCLTNGKVTFGALASQIKITTEVVEAWCSILSRCPGSMLVVRNGALESATTREFVYSLFFRNGISRDRVRLRGSAPHFEFLRTYEEIDIALDTFPYNGGTTTTEAIWQGVPVVTFWGDRWVSRTSASILRAGGLGEFVRSNIGDYISFAAELANSAETPRLLTMLRRGMRAQLMSSPLCDTVSFARTIETFYKGIDGRGL